MSHFMSGGWLGQDNMNALAEVLGMNITTGKPRKGDDMASLSCSKNGLKTIQFTAKEGKRRSIRLGKLPKKAAESVKTMVEHLVTASISGFAIDNKAAQWLAELDDVMLNRLARVGLAQPRESAMLQLFIDGYIAKRKDVKASTATVYAHTRRNLIEYFGPEKPI